MLQIVNRKFASVGGTNFGDRRYGDAPLIGCEIGQKHGSAPALTRIYRVLASVMDAEAAAAAEAARAARVGRLEAERTSDSGAFDASLRPPSAVQGARKEGAV